MKEIFSLTSGEERQSEVVLVGERPLAQPVKSFERTVAPNEKKTSGTQGKDGRLIVQHISKIRVIRKPEMRLKYRIQGHISRDSTESRRIRLASLPSTAELNKANEPLV